MQFGRRQCRGVREECLLRDCAFLEGTDLRVWKGGGHVRGGPAAGSARATRDLGGKWPLRSPRILVHRCECECNLPEAR
jgi:hypothetical protein